jgi:predicted porin
LACLNLQAGGSYVLNSLDTPVAGSAGINNIVLNSVNDYWTVDASAGYEFNEKTHLQVQYTYYRADDYVNNAGPSTTAAGANGTNVGLPYGAGDEQHSVTATVTRQISKAVQVSVKYGYYRNRDQTSGGQNDYDAQLVYVSTQLRF